MEERRGKARRVMAFAVAGLIALASAACTSGSSGNPLTSGSSSDPSAPMLVWVDASRQTAAQAYATAHPESKFNIQVVDAGQMKTKLGLLLRGGDSSAVPDAVFTPNGNAVEFHMLFDFPAEMTGVVGADKLKDFGAALSQGTSPDGVYALPYDLSTGVLWYNKAVMDEFGYQIPTTFAEYASIAAKVAKDHPGYIVGSCGDAFCANVFYRSNGVKGLEAAGSAEAKVTIDTDPLAAEVTGVLDPLIADGSVSKLGPFDEGMAKAGSENKVLMLPGFVWYGTVLFQGVFKSTAGSIAAAPMPAWSDGKQGQTAASGGQWMLNKSSVGKKPAVDLVVSLTTDVDSLAKEVTFPAYAAAVEPWLANLNSGAYFAGDTAEVLKLANAATSGVNLATPVGFDLLGTFGDAVAPGLKEGKSLRSLTPGWSKQLAQSATDAGWTVTNVSK